MSRLVKKTLALLIGSDNPADFMKLPKGRPFKAITERELIQLESEIGRELFGAVPSGHRREFFNLDPHTWIWYEEYLDANGNKQSTTTRYELQEKGVLKAQDGARYSYIEGEELDNLLIAINMYFEQVARKIYKRDPSTGKKLL
ncbi:MAG TPA: hypothetical protein PL051_01570 [Candidatus Saccharibacteria bacterium]|nr:hypothetical protein [Candidatus Saccharibacteria bacterium]